MLLDLSYDMSGFKFVTESSSHTLRGIYVVHSSENKEVIPCHNSVCLQEG